jgi:L-asparaginase II
MGADPALPAHEPLAVATRGGGIESVHYGSIAVTDRSGSLLYWAGDPAAMVFGRSSLKPFQVVPLVAHPDVARYDFTDREIAVICASHSGEPRHVEVVLGILGKIGCDRRALQCGVHAPLYFEAIGQRPSAEDIYTPLHHNCSGKHAGMLALARLLNAPIDGYLNPDHPVQQAILDAICHYTGLPRSAIAAGVDGCSAPTFAVPLSALARACARLTEDVADARYGDAGRVIFHAMTSHPEMVSGLKRLDLALMHAGCNDLLAKGGAEAVHVLALRRRGFGIAIKIADGAARADHAVTVEVLRQLGVIGDLAGTPLEFFGRPKVTNWRGLEVGEVLPVLRLRQAE